MKKGIAAICLMLLVFQPYAYGDEDCISLATCQTDIDNANDGDIITLTQSDSSWDDTLTISKGVHFRGSSSSVEISGSGKIEITRDATHHIEISNITFNGIGVEVTNGTGKSVLIHDTAWINKNGCIKLYNNGAVIYSNTFTAATGWLAWSAIQMKNVSGLTDWQTASTMGKDDTDGERNTYIEDNTFTDFVTECLDFDDASRVVLRYNTFSNSGIASHGFCSSGVGSRHWEIYRNDFQYESCETNRCNVANGWVKIRGGTGVVFGNNWDTISGYWGSKGDLNLAVWAIGDGENCGEYPDDCCSSYPCTRQVSHSHTGSDYIIDPVYYWENTDMSVGFDGNGDPCGGLAIGDVLQSGVNYVDVAKPNYTPYPYPHPLRAITGTYFQSKGNVSGGVSFSGSGSVSWQ